MANKQQLRCIARNLIAKVALSGQFDSQGLLSEKDEQRLDEEIKRVAYSIVVKTYKSKYWTTSEIIKDILKNR